MMFHMIRFICLTLAAPLILGACTQNSSPLDQQLEEIAEALPGSYAGTMSAGSETLVKITHRFEKITAPRFGDYVFFYEIASDAQNGPGTQFKIFVFDTDPDRTANSMSAYLLTPDQLPESDGSRNWNAINPEDLRDFPDVCDFSWSKTDDGFAGVVRAEDCLFPSEVFEGNIRSDMTYQISGDTLFWEETLLTDGYDVIVSTFGLKEATRVQVLE